MTPTQGPIRPDQPTVDARRLWAGGAATAAVAALVAIVGVLVFDGVLDVAMVHPPLLALSTSFVANYALTSALLALLATGLAHVLVLTTPRPGAFFLWIIGLVTAAGVAFPFALDGTAAEQFATAIVNLLIGLSVGSLVASVMRRTVTPGV